MSCTILSNVNLITSRVELAFKNSKCVTNYPKIVAVSKFKTIENIIEAYNCGLRFFGENYVQELLKKAQDEKVITNCPDIKWHFIGKLQSKNVNKILRVPNLYVIETLESIDIAKSLNEKLGNLERKEKLKVMIQINSSGAEAKGGISPDEVVEFTSKIIQNFENLNFIGLMTIGAIHNVIEGSSNPDFVTLYNCREQVCKALNLSSDDVQLSMGMSNDFEHAVEFTIMGNLLSSKCESVKIENKSETDKPKCKACCACPETRRPRDECIAAFGEENCQELILAHKDCMKKLGFDI